MFDYDYQYHPISSHLKTICGFISSFEGWLESDIMDERPHNAAQAPSSKLDLAKLDHNRYPRRIELVKGVKNQLITWGHRLVPMQNHINKDMYLNDHTCMYIHI